MKETQQALDRARQIYEYRDGMLFWKEKTGRKVVVGSRAGTAHPTLTYREVRIDGLHYKEHRVIWAIHHGKWPEHQIDHINRFKDDNRIENLRDVSPSVNLRNTGIRSNNTSGSIGVRWRADRNKWQAYVSIGGKFKNIGHYITKPEAEKARIEFIYE